MNRSVVFIIIITILSIVCSGICFSEEDLKAENVFDLGDVLVTEKGGQVDLATTVNTVTLQDIERQGAQNAAEALELIPGVDIQIGSKGHSSLKLRGFSQEDVKVLIDGVPAHESYFGSLDLDQIPAESIARIEITKGASSVLYGANTMGGVINIITKKGGKEPFTRLTTSFGGNDTQNYTLNHGASFGKFNYWLTCGFRTSDGFELSDHFDPDNSRTGLESEYNEDGGVRDLSYYTKRTLNTKVGYEFDSTSKIYLSLDYHNNEKGCPTESTRKGSRYWEYANWDQWHLNLVGEHDITGKITLKARAFYVDHEDTLEDIGWEPDHITPKDGKWFEKSAYDDYSQGGELHSYVDFGKWSLLKIGMNYLKDNHKQEDFLDENSAGVGDGKEAGWQGEEEYEAITYTFAVEDEIQPVNKLAIILGFSYDAYKPEKAHNTDVQDTIHTFNPQAGVVYDATDSLSLHASVGKKTRFPQLQELYSERSGGDDGLDPQKTIAYEIGASTHFSSSLKVSMAVFYNDIENRIESDKDDNGDKYYKNIGESDIWGMEMDLVLTPFQGFRAGLNYTFLTAEEKAEKNAPTTDSENTPDHKVNLDVNYDFKFGMSTSLQASYTGEQVEYDKKNVKYTMDDFFLVNCRIRQTLKKLWKIDSECFFEVKNIFDENYEEGKGPAPGRSFLAGLSVTY